jgi:hypothetical protein
MPLFPNDQLQPGSEKLAEAVPTSVVRDIVRDLRNGPSALPIVTPQPYPVGSGWVEPVPLRPYEGAKHVDAICEAFAAEDRVAKVEALARRVANLQVGRDAEIKELRDEVARLQAELAKVQGK